MMTFAVKNKGCVTVYLNGLTVLKVP